MWKKEPSACMSWTCALRWVGECGLDLHRAKCILYQKCGLCGDSRFIGTEKSSESSNHISRSTARRNSCAIGNFMCAGKELSGMPACDHEDAAESQQATQERKAVEQQLEDVLKKRQNCKKCSNFCESVRVVSQTALRIQSTELFLPSWTVSR